MDKYFMSFNQDITSLTKKINLGKRKKYYFYMRNFESESGPIVRVNGKEMIMLGSNNYLGLSFHPKVKEAAVNAMKKYGVGSGGVRLLCGTYKLHEELEEEIAKFKKTESAIAFCTGFMTNAGAIPVITNRDTVIINDDKNHASIIDGCRASKAKMRVYSHNKMEKLENILGLYPIDKNKLIIADSVFSMDGDVANLPDIFKLAQKYNAHIMIDDAHATGVLGKTGAGALEHFGLMGKIDIVMGTLSKALGSLGGFMATTKGMVTYLKHATREFIFSTSLPPAIAAGAKTAIQVLQNEPHLIKHLWRNINYMKNELKRMGYDTGNSQSAIIPILLKDEVKTYKMVQLLDNGGVFVNPITFPAVRRAESRIRVSMMALHTLQNLDRALDAFKKAGKQLDLI